MSFSISVRELPLSGIRSREQLSLFVLASLGITDMPSSEDDVKKVMPDVQILTELMIRARRNEGVKVSELKFKVDLKQTALYARIKKFLDAGLIYKAKGSVYKLKERTLNETLKFRVKKDIESKLSSIIEVAEELDEKMKQNQ